MPTDTRPPVEPRLDTLTLMGGRIRVDRSAPLKKSVTSSGVFEAEWVGAVPDGQPERLAWKEVSISVSPEGPPRERIAYERIEELRTRYNGGDTIVRCVGVVEEADMRYLVMERTGPNALVLSRGITIDGERRQFVGDLVTCTFRALDHLEAVGVHNRDVHPGNIMAELGSGNAAPTKFLLGDFGHAYVTDEFSGEVPSFVSGSAGIHGQQAMQSPDIVKLGAQHRGLVDDLFSLGMTAYLLAAGDHLTAWRSSNGKYLTYATEVPDGYEFEPDFTRLEALDNDIAIAVQLMLEPRAEKRLDNVKTIKKLLEQPEFHVVKPTVATRVAIPLDVPKDLLEDEQRSGMAVLSDFRRQPTTLPPRVWVPQRYRRAGALAVTVLVPLVVAAVALFAPGIGIVGVSELLGVTPEFATVCAALVGVIALTTLVVGLFSLRGRAWSPGTIRERLIWGAVFSLGGVILVGYLAPMLAGIEIGVVASSFAGLDWSMDRWGAAQWLIFAVAALLVLVLAGALIAERKTWVWVPVGTAGLAAFVCAIIVFPVLGGTLLPAEVGAVGAQTAASCGANEYTMTRDSTRLCVAEVASWEQVQGEDFAAAPYVVANSWTEEVPAGTSPASSYLMLQSRDHPCLTSYLGVRSGYKTSSADTREVQLSEDDTVTISRLDDEGRRMITNLAGVPYFVYGSLERESVTSYVPFAPYLGDAALDSRYGTTNAFATFIADDCGAEALAAGEELARELLEAAQVRDTGYLDLPYFQLAGTALDGAGVTLDRVRVPLDADIVSGHFEKTTAEITNGTASAIGAVFLSARETDGPWAKIHFTIEPSPIADVAVESEITPWSETPFVVDEDGRSSRSYFRSIDTGAGHLYIQVEVFARLDRDDSVEFRAIVKRLLDGISVEEE